MGQEIDKECAGAVVQVIDNCLVVCGGYHDSSCIVYDFQTREWSDLPPMLVDRHDAASAVVGKSLYVFGGRGRDIHGRDDALLAACERFDTASSLWQVLTPTGDTFRAITAAPYLPSGVILVFGASRDSGSTEVCLDAVQRFDSKSNQWLAAEDDGVTITPLNKTLEYPRAFIWQDRAFVLGTSLSGHRRGDKHNNPPHIELWAADLTTVKRSTTRPKDEAVWEKLVDMPTTNEVLGAVFVEEEIAETDPEAESRTGVKRKSTSAKSFSKVKKASS